MALEAFKGKTVISLGVGVFVAFFSGWRALVRKNRGSCKVWGFLKILVDFLRV
jgi:hypothetical protein